MAMVLSGTVGVKADNHPADVSKVRLRLQELGFEDIVDARATLFGFSNFEKFGDRIDNGKHGFGTDWLQALITQAGAHFRDNYLSNPQNSPAELIRVNDASLDKGVDTKDHGGHETGLMCDIRLPTKPDASARPDHYSRPGFDRTAARALVDAFRATGSFEPQVIILNDPHPTFNGLTTHDPPNQGEDSHVHDDHLHIQVKVPDRSGEVEAELTLTGTVGKGGANAAEDVKNVRQRLLDLGFHWIAAATEEAAGTADAEFLRTIRLFQGIIAGKGRPTGSGRIDPGLDSTPPAPDETLKWLRAKNAPRWLQGGLSDGDPSIDQPSVDAIKLFQAIVSDKPLKDVDGWIQTNRATHQWLDADNAPGWGPVPLGGDGRGFDFADTSPAPHDHWAGWLADVVVPAAQKYHDEFLATNSNSRRAQLELASFATGGAAAIEGGLTHENGLTIHVQPFTFASDGLPDPAAMEAFFAAINSIAAEKKLEVEIRFATTPVTPGLYVVDPNFTARARIHVKPPVRKKRGPGVIELFPPKDQPAPDNGLHDIGIYLIASSDATQVDALSFAVPSADAAAPGDSFGWRIPLKTPTASPLAVDTTAASATKNLVLKSQSSAPADDCNVLPLAADFAPAEKRWELAVPPSFSLGGAWKLESAAIVFSDDFQRAVDGTLTGGVRLDVVIGAPSLPRKLKWSIDPSSSAGTGHIGSFRFADLGDGFELSWPLRSKKTPFDFALPMLLKGGTLSGDLTLKIDGNLTPRVELAGRIAGELGIDLGSPLARLSLKPDGAELCEFSFHSESGFSLTLPERIEPTLSLDLFKKLNSAVVNNVWKSGAAEHLLAVKLNAPTAPPADGGADDEEDLEDAWKAVRTLRWSGGFPSVSLKLLERFFNALPTTALSVITARKLQSLTGLVLGGKDRMEAAFRSVEKALSFKDGVVSVDLGLEVTAGTSRILDGSGTFSLKCDRAVNGAIAMLPGAFEIDDAALTLKTVAERSSSFSQLVELIVPAGSKFKFSLDPTKPSLTYEPDPTAAKIRIQSPAGSSFAAKSRFIFDLEGLKLHSGGFDLRGGVRAEKVAFDAADKNDGASAPVNSNFPFAEPLAVRSPERNNGGTPVGTIEFLNSNLVSASLRASAKLAYFDDAVGTLSIALSQSPADKRIQARGMMEISGLSEFHIDALYASCQIRNFQFGLAFDGGRWSADASISGRLKFAPPRGGSAGDLKELADLFKGITCEFERLNPLKLGRTPITIQFPAKRFNFAEVISVDLRGVTIGAGKDGKAFDLLADAELKKLPGLNSSLRFGGISLRAGGGVPKFTVKRIGASFRSAGGFELDGELDFIEFEEESGFVGAFTLKTESLPRLSGLVKLTRVMAVDKSGRVPSLALFVEGDVTAPLPAGFYLRSLGVGLGVFQALRGLDRKDLPLPKRIAAFVNNPAGLPEPRRAESWVPAPPATSRVALKGLNWMLVGSGLITLGKSSNTTAHPMAGGILLAIDQDLNIVAGVNLWLFASPNDVRTAEFVQRPVGRGAIGISIREQRVFAMFQTVKNPKMRSDAPPILSEVLKSVETRLLLNADRDGVLIEIGWPWETRIKHKLAGIINGELRCGFRVGNYRGVTSFGLNYAVLISVETSREVSFGTRYGDAQASLTVSGRGEFRASFIGALTPSLKLYLYGDVRLSATVEVKASASVSFRIKLSRWIKISVSISFSRSIRISLSAALEAAIAPGPDLGFRGSAQVSVSVSGYRLAGAVAIGHNEGIINRTRDKIESMLPPSLAAQIAGPLALAAAAEPPPPPEGWHFRHRIVGDRVRILLFPMPGTLYPSPGLPANVVLTPERRTALANLQKNLKRFTLRIKRKDLFKGFVGDDEKPDIVDITGNAQAADFIWGESSQVLDRPLAELPASEAAFASQVPTLRNLLAGLQGVRPDLTHFRNVSEEADLRVFRPTPDQTDDETTTIARREAPSPNFRRDTAYDQALAGAWLNAQATPSIVLSAEDARPGEIPTIATVVNELKTAAARSAETAATGGLIHETEVAFYPKEFQAWYSRHRTNKAGLPAWSNMPTYFEALPAEEFSDLRVDALWRIDPNPPGDEPLDGLIVALRGSQLTVVVDPDRYDGLDPAKILAELLQLLRDEDAEVGKPLADENRRWIGGLRLVLEFDIPPGSQHLGPRLVEELIDIDPDLKIQSIVLDEDSGDPTVVEQTFPVRAVVGTKEPPEYDLVAGPVFPSESQICLSWLLLREDPDEALAAGPQSDGLDTPLVPVASPFAPYEELDKFVVTRSNLSRLGDDPVALDVYPAWITSQDGQTLIRPQFQFVDDRLDDVSPGDQLQYEISAEAPDRTLVSCLINVIRQVLRPLPPLTEAAAVHVLADDTDRDRLEFCIHVDPELLKEEKLTAEQFGDTLKLMCRLVAADPVGLYGFTSSAAPPTTWEPGSPVLTGTNRLAIDFPRGDFARALPWSEVEDVFRDVADRFTWTSRLVGADGVELRDGELNDDKVVKRLAYTLILPASKLAESLVREWRHGKALEFHVGREIPPKNRRGTQRSPLLRCRHAIIPRGTPLAAGNSDDAANLKRGNGVGAVEFVPEGFPSAEWLDTARIQAVVDYSVVRNPPPDEEQADPVGGPDLRLVWRHDLSGRAGFDDPQGFIPEHAGFNPVVGYRVFREDLYDVNPPRPEPEQIVRAVPEPIYRAEPATIEILGISDKRVPDVEATRPQRPENVDEAVADRFQFGVADRVADWIPVVDRIAPFDAQFPHAVATIPNILAVTPGTPTSITDSRTTFCIFDRPAGAVLLQLDVALYLHRLSNVIDPTNPPTIIFPGSPLLEFRSRTVEPGREAETIASHLESLEEQWTETTDPYGWRALGALGCSCEVRLEFAGTPVPAEKVFAAVRRLAASSESVRPVSIAFFLADDGETPLDVFRLIYAPMLADWTALPEKRLFALDTALGFAALGTTARPQTATFAGKPVTLISDANVVSDEIRGAALPRFQQWLAKVNARIWTPADAGKIKARSRSAVLTAGLTAETQTLALDLHAVAFRYDPCTTRTEAAADDASPSKSEISLKIAHDGRIGLVFKTPDRWAHDYRLAVGMVRRYDLARGGAGVPEVMPDPAKHAVTVEVARTQPLVPHNLTASPLPSGVQALVFRHPASFAAAASAAQAAHIQYSGQSVLLERRIDPELRNWLQRMYDNFVQLGVNWKTYQESFLAPIHEQPVTPPDPPELLTRAEINGSWRSTAAPLRPADIGLPAIYGADRYAWPDLPAYYQYRVTAFSTAGMSVSPPAHSDWVSPLYSSGPTDVPRNDAPRQRPGIDPTEVQVVPGTEFAEDQGKPILKLRVPLLHPRQHMPRECRGLWIESEETLALTDAAGPPSTVSLRFGSLPDLFLDYQLYWISGGGAASTPVYIPLLQVRSPEVVVAGTALKHFQIEIQTAGMLPLSSDSTLAPNLDARIVQADDGQLLFEIALDLSDARCEPLRAALDAVDPDAVDPDAARTVADVFRTAVSREGVWSEILN